MDGKLQFVESIINKSSVSVDVWYRRLHNILTSNRKSLDRNIKVKEPCSRHLSILCLYFFFHPPKNTYKSL